MTVTFNDLKRKYEDRKNIIRVAKNKDNPYVMVNKSCINDSNLTWAAKGLHTYLMSLPDDWTIYINELTTHTSAGRDHTYKVVKELLQFGYMERIEYRFQGKVLGGTYTVFETPIDVSTCDNTKSRIVSVYVNDNGEIVENTKVEPFTENPDTVKPDTDSTSLLNNNSTKILKELNNNLDDDDATNLINLYKTFKLEKRVMPHTVKLLKTNLHINVDVFEQLFINATSKDNVYRYLQETLKDLNKNKIVTLDDFNKHLESRKNKSHKGSSTPKKNKSHNFDSHVENMTEKEIMESLKVSQNVKFGDGSLVEKENIHTEETDPLRKTYIQAIENNWENIGPGTYNMAKKYALKYNKPYKEQQ